MSRGLSGSERVYRNIWGKLSLLLIKHHRTQVYGGVDIYLHSFFASELDRGERDFTFHLLQVSTYRYSLSAVQSGRCGQEKISCLQWEQHGYSLSYRPAHIPFTTQAGLSRISIPSHCFIFDLINTTVCSSGYRQWDHQIMNWRGAVAHAEVTGKLGTAGGAQYIRCLDWVLNPGSPECNGRLLQCLCLLCQFGEFFGHNVLCGNFCLIVLFEVSCYVCKACVVQDELSMWTVNYTTTTFATTFPVHYTLLMPIMDALVQTQTEVLKMFHKHTEIDHIFSKRLSLFFYLCLTVHHQCR